jgi:TonB family protein
MHQHNRILWGTVALSAAVHLILFTIFYYKKHVAVNGKHGVVSVSFIQSVHHETSISSPVRVKSHRSHPSAAMKAAEPVPAQAEPPPNVESGDPNAINHESNIFISTVSRMLEQKKVYPQSAIDREEEGKVIVGLTLDREGTLTAANVEEPSPFALLNEAALQTVRAVAKFPPVPAVVAAPIHLHVPLIYRIERN